MPELPDVEVFRRHLAANALRKRIVTVEIKSQKILGNVSARKLRYSLLDRRFRSTKRHGKHLFVQLNSSGWLAMHFGMTGSIKYFKGGDEAPAYDRLLIGFANGCYLGYSSRRLLGKIDVVENPTSAIAARHLGPDALDAKFDVNAFVATLQARKGIIKSTLMDQGVIAGIGNIYADEILFRARIHPKTRVDALDKKHVKRLHRSMISVLQKAIACGTDPARLPRTYLIPQRHAGGHCPRCGTKLACIKIAARSSYLCSRCQGKPVTTNHSIQIDNKR